MNKITLGILLIVAGLMAGFMLSSPHYTASLWTTSLKGEIKSPTAVIGQDLFAIMSPNSLIKVDQQGTLLSQVALPAENLHPIVALDASIAVADRKGAIRVYSSQDLHLTWERQLQEIQDLPLLALPGNKLLARVAKSNIFLLDGATGNPLWEAQVNGDIVHVVADQTLACVYGYRDLQSSFWKLCGIDLDTGDILWNFPHAVEDQAPIAVGDFLVFCDKKGRPSIIDQKTGEIKYQHEKDGLKLIAVLENRLITLAAGGSRLDALSLETGKSWSANLPSPLGACFGKNEFIYIVDGNGIRCVSADSGLIKWEKELGKTFNSFSLPEGICVTYKETYLARGTYFSCFDFQTGAPYWTSQDQGIFWKPFSIQKGHLVACRTGTLSLMPKPLPVSVALPPEMTGVASLTSPASTATFLGPMFQLKMGLPTPSPTSPVRPPKPNASDSTKPAAPTWD